MLPMHAVRDNYYGVCKGLINSPHKEKEIFVAKQLNANIRRIDRAVKQTGIKL